MTERKRSCMSHTKKAVLPGTSLTIRDAIMDGAEEQSSSSPPPQT